jgi:hypothetical protein
MTERTRHTASSESQRPIPSGDITYGEYVEGVEEEVAELVERLPDDVGLIELVMAEGNDPQGLEQMLQSLPDEDEIEQLAAALDDPNALEALLTERDQDATRDHQAPGAPRA